MKNIFVKKIGIKQITRRAVLLLIVSAMSGLLFTNEVNAQSVGISNSSITPDASSIMELRTTTKGLLMPRMTTTQRDAITTPATGLVIYNTTTNLFNFYTGSAWSALSTSAGGVNSVAGTTNRISIGGTAADPVVDISGTYVGQSSITTLGTITTGTWNGTTVSIANGGTGQTTQQAAINSLAGIQSSGKYLRSDGTNTTLSTIVAADVPTLNQNTSGSAATLTTPRNIYGNTFNGSADITSVITSTYLPTALVYNNQSNTYTAGMKQIFGSSATTAGVNFAGIAGDISAPANGDIWRNTTSDLFKYYSGGLTKTLVNTDASQTLSNKNFTGSGNTFPTFNQNTTGNAATVTTNANLSGDVTSVGNATTLATVNTNVGSWNTVTVNGKGLVTAGSNITYVTSETDPTVKAINGIVKSNGTTISAATVRVDYAEPTTTLATGILKNTTTTGTHTIAIASDFPTLNQNTTGNAATVTTNANLTGDVTSVGNATTLATVNSNIGTFNSVTVNAKGLITAASNTTTELTGKTNADVNSTYPDNATYWSNVTAANGFPVNGNLSGIRKGTLNSQRIQDQLNGSTYARAWIDGTTSWTAWAIYLDGNDFTAKGQMHLASGNNSVGVLSVGTDGQVLVADAASANGVKWGAVTGTGNVVLATSPTLITPILGVASSTSQTITGTGGTGYVELQTQSSNPTSGTANTIRLFSNSLGGFSWIRATDGFSRSFNSVFTANRTFTLPDANGTIPVSASGNIALSTVGNISFTGVLPIANGGTNSTAVPTNGGVAYGDGTAYQITGAGTARQILQSNGTAAPTWVNGGTMMLTGNSNNTAVNNTILFYPVDGSLAGNATDAQAGLRTLISRTGTIRNLYVKLSAALGAGKTGTVTLYKNGVATVLVATLSVGPTLFSDLTNAISVVAGDEIGIQVNTTGNVKFSWAMELTY